MKTNGMKPLCLRHTIIRGEIVDTAGVDVILGRFIRYLWLDTKHFTYHFKTKAFTYKPLQLLEPRKKGKFVVFTF
jgi:hypothetical protein